MKNKIYTAILTIAVSTTANAAEPLKTTAPVQAPAVTTAPPAPPAAPSAPAVVKAPAAPAVTKPNTAKTAAPTAPKVNKAVAPAAPKAEKPAVVAKPDETTLRQLNKKYLLDFVRAANAGDVASFYKANPQFAGSISQAQFVQKFGKYNNELPKGDLPSLEANDFANTTVTSIADNKRYKGCQLVEAKSEVKLQVVQDSHDYKLTNRYCFKEGDYKLVSFKLGYQE